MIDTVLQSLIIAAVVAGATGYVSGRVMEAKINGMKEALARLESEIKSIRDRLHDWSPHIGWVEQERRWAGRDRGHESVE